MSSQPLSSPVPATPRLPAPAFEWVFTVCGVLTPMLLIVYAFATSPEAIERAQIVVQGLESTVFALVAALAVRALYVFGLESDPTNRIAESTATSASASA